MREILFRGKLPDTKEWVEGFVVKGRCTYILTTENIHYMSVSVMGHASVDVLPVIPDSVGQYTGLIDKNGKRIFEGDIVAGTKYGKPCTGVIEYGKWNCGCCWGVYGFAAVHGPEIRDSEQNLEVIGNIYDNPELIPEMEEDDEG